jgi:hypothetical protein
MPIGADSNDDSAAEPAEHRQITGVRSRVEYRRRRVASIDVQQSRAVNVSKPGTPIEYDSAVSSASHWKP